MAGIARPLAGLGVLLAENRADEALRLPEDQADFAVVVTAFVRHGRLYHPATAPVGRACAGSN